MFFSFDSGIIIQLGLKKLILFLRLSILPFSPFALAAKIENFILFLFLPPHHLLIFLLNGGVFFSTHLFAVGVPGNLLLFPAVVVRKLEVLQGVSVYFDIFVLKKLPCFGSCVLSHGKTCISFCYISHQRSK